MKNYILDTNVLLHDPNSLLSFQENSVLIPIEVIEEIDRFKRESSELGQNARAVSRQLDGLRAQGHLSEGVPLPNGGRLLQAFPQDASVEVVDWRRPEGLKRRDAGGLTCAGVTINGKNAFDLEMDGKKAKVLFVRGIDGEWTEADLTAAVKQELAKAGVK